MMMTVFALNANAQLRTAYFMEGSTFRNDMNPALAPTRGYFNFPFIGNMSLQLNNNFLSVKNFLYPNPEGSGLVTFLHPSVDRNDFLKRMPNNGILGIETNLNLIGFGAHTKKFFWNAGLNFRTAGQITIPKQFLSLVTTLGQGYYDMNSLNVNVDSYMELFVGASIPIKQIANIGFRVKGLMGVATADLNVDNMYVNITDDFIDARMRGTLRANTIASRQMAAGEEFDAGALFDLDNLGFKNYGGSVDVGAEVRLFGERLRLSAAVTDLGFIMWDRSHTVNGNIGAGVTYRGFDFDTMEADTEVEDFEMVFGKPMGGYMKRLNTNINVGIEYAILRDRISFGVLSHTRFYSTSATTELTASVNFKPVNWLTASASHTFLNGNKLGVMGFALNIHPRGLNLFLGTDFVDFKRAKSKSIPVGIPVSLQSTNVYFGFGFSFKRATYTKSYKDDVAAGRVKVKK